MKMSQEVYDKLKYLDRKYEKGWDHLPRTHPDIVELQSLTEEAERSNEVKVDERTGKWTKKEEDFLRENLKKHTKREIAQMLGRTYRSVMNKSTDLGLKKPRRKVIQYDIDGNELNRYETATAAQKATGIPRRNIASVCDGVFRQAKGFIWRYEEEY